MKKLLLVALLCSAGMMFAACCKKECKPCAKKCGCKDSYSETCAPKPKCTKTVEVCKEPCKVCETVKTCHWECPTDTKMEETK